MRDAPEVELPAGLLETLAAELDGLDVLGIALRGSFARGTPTRLSDLDLTPFYDEGTALPPKRLFYRDGWLVSVAPKSLTSWRAQMAQPEWAIYLVPSAAEMRLLRDREGALAALVAEARAFDWAPLQPAADAFAGETLLVEVEHAQKVLAGLVSGDSAELCRGLGGLLYALPWAVATQRGVMVTSGNTFYAQVQAAAGDESAWSRALRAALGIETSNVGDVGDALDRRGVAGLRLYAETARLLEHVVRPDEARVAREFIALAGRMGRTL